MVDNPFAFPFPGVRDSDGCGIMEGSTGMDLRDWFAGQALAGFLADGSQRHLDAAHRLEPDFLDLGPIARASVLNQQLAIGCYALADAMLAARKEPGA